MSSSSSSSSTEAAFNPESVNLDTADPADVICYLTAGETETIGHLGAHISSIFVLLVVSTATTVFPVLAERSKRWKIPLGAYLFARYFGAGVIIATAFIHLLDPAYEVIGPNSCVGMTGGWSTYSWPPTLAMTSALTVFLLDFLAECYVEYKYGSLALAHANVEAVVTSTSPEVTHAPKVVVAPTTEDALVVVVTTQGHDNNNTADAATQKANDAVVAQVEREIERQFHQQIVAFFVLEFGVIFHSVIIGLNLGVAGAEFRSLYPVIVFHQGFEGLGIGARLCVIPFPHRFRWLPWVLCLVYGLTTPTAVAVGLSLRESYSGGSYTANVVAGVLDSISAGILLYTGLVEFLAKDFLFDPSRTKDKKRLLFMLVCLYMGVAMMALLGKWA